MDGFGHRRVDTGEAVIDVHHAGNGPGVLLLHGFPETQLMWRDIAPRLTARFTVVTADLRGYGASSTPPSDDGHAPYSKRAMARDATAVMADLGFDTFAVVGHDRGGRVAYRAALDHPEHVRALAVLDVVPVDVAWERADARLTLGFWPWSLLAQAAPLPEAMLLGAPEAVVGQALSAEWGTPAETFDDDIRAAYTRQLRDADHVHAICEEYRAAAGIDREHDASDRAADRTITCPTLALWSGPGPLGSWYDDVGGPLGIWRELADQVEGSAVDGGHFFPEERPAETVDALAEFLARALGA